MTNDQETLEGIEDTVNKSYRIHTTCWLSASAWDLQIFDEPLHSLSERCFFTNFDVRIIQITTDGETMSAAFVEVALVPRSELAATEDFVSLGLSFGREHTVNRARVDQEGSSGSCEVFLSDIRKNRATAVNNEVALTSRSAGTCKRDGCATTPALMTFSKARSKT